MTTRNVEILLVEDNPGDVRLTREALAEAGVDNQLAVVQDGVEAMEYLYREGSYQNVKRPDLVLLDLNLPRKNGREVLAEIKNDTYLKRIPVVVLSTSVSTDDITAAYESHANCYISKPADLNQYIAVIQSVEHFWLSTVELPPE
jgi:chemotaxis family two-component system response regulator Rcp1